MKLDFYIKNISVNLNKLISLFSMNLLELSKKSGVSYSSLHNLLNQKQNPTLDTLIRICKTFDINLSQLIGDTPLFKNDKSFFVKEIPVINKIDILNFNCDRDDFEESIIISYPRNIRNKCFALKNENFNSFSQNTIFFFELITNNINSYSNQVALIYNNNNICLKKLILDGDQIFLESIDNDLPTRRINNDKLIAYLFQTRVDY